jgi:hypothetical protein
MKKRLPLCFLLSTLYVVTSSAGVAQQRLFAGRVANQSTVYDVYPYGWSTYQILGKPNVYPLYGDIADAYNPAGFGGQRDFIDLEFDNNGPIDSIFIYETFTPGFVDSVFVKNPGTQAWDLVYAAPADTLAANARILAIGFPTTAYPVRFVRLGLANDISPGWVEIDAVAISPSTVAPFVPETTPGYAYTFNGTTDIYSTYSSLLNLITDTGATITAWVNIHQPTAPAPADVFDGAAVLCDGDGTYLGIYLANVGGSDSLYFYNYDGSNDYFGMDFTPNTWFHIAWVHHNGFLSAYKNGVLYRTIPSGTTEYIGTRALEMGFNLNSGEYFQGEIDEVTCFNRALHATEVDQVRRMNVPASMPGLTGYWQMSNCDELHFFNPYNHIADSLKQLQCITSGVPDFTGLNEAEANQPNLQVYPNPTTGITQVTLSLTGGMQVAVYDLMGRLVMQTNPLLTSATTLDLTELPHGVYLVQVLDANKKTHQVKLVKH